jgi:uncharacterized protein DUF6602
MLENCYGQHGWKEFYRNRKDVLAEFDKILEQTSNRPIQVAHGQGVEAYLRKWLAEFLPKKYGVTSGYIIPDLYNDTGKIYHFDIIIYNQLEAPILWTEGNEDQSEQGKYRAIPAKHVVSVFEVKSRFTKKNVKESIEKLDQTKDFKDQFDPLFTCGIVFIDLKQEDNNKESIIKELINGRNVHGFSGGVVLRYEGDDTCTGLIRVFPTEKDKHIDNEHLTPLSKPIDELNIYLVEDGSLKLAERGSGAKLVATSDNSWSVTKTYGVIYTEPDLSVHLDWSRTNFSDFCIDLLSSLEGIPFNDKNEPSFGQIFDNIERKKAPLQELEAQAGKPFLETKLYDGGEHGQTLVIDDKNSEIKILIEVKNNGDSEAIISDDTFKSTCELPPNKTAIRAFTLKAEFKENKESLKELLDKKPIEIAYRLVYYPQTTESEKDFFAIETKLKITSDNVEIIN